MTRRPTVGQVLGRALARRCPVCGRGAMFDGWFAVRTRCAACGFLFERDEEDDYWLGALLLNFIGAEVVFALLLLVVLFVTWPSPPWTPLIWISGVQTIVAPIVAYPFSKALWLGGDLLFRPPTAADFAAREGEDTPPA